MCSRVIVIHKGKIRASDTAENLLKNQRTAGSMRVEAKVGTDKASEVNEQSSIGLLTGKGKILVRQIAGLVARRIITDHQPGTAVAQAQRMGLIRFGSRVDVFLPAAATVTVRVGERTQAGRTVIARWN
jgi:phosphatidylserine decarboxylase precursor-related protein